jgi:hypothetical protein
MPRIDIKNKSFIDFVGEGITTSNAGALAIVNIGGGTFLSLIDTPASYAGSNTKLVGVNAAGDGLEFVDGGSGSITGDITFNGTITDQRVGSFELISSADNITGTAASISIAIVDNNFGGGDHIKIVGRPYTTGDLVPGTDFAIGIDVDATAQNLADKINLMNIEATATVMGSVVTVTADYGGTWGNLFKVYKTDGITENFSITGGEVFYDYGIAENGWLFTGGTNGPAHNNDDRTILTFNNKDGMEKLQLVMGPGNNGSPGFYTTQGRSLFFMANTDYAYQYPGYQSVEVGLWPWNPSYSISIEDAGTGNSEFELRTYAGWIYTEDQVSGDYGWVGAFTQNYNEAGRNDVRFIAEAIGHIGLTDQGVFFGGNQYSNPDRWAFESQAVNGAGSIAYQLDTRNQLTTFGAKLLSLQNFTVEKFAVDKDGNLTLGGTVDGVDVSTLPAAINAKMTNPMTTSGDIIYGAGSGVPARLPKAANGQYLSLVSGLPAWVTLPGGITTFTGLSDTPSSYSGQGTKAVRVNSGATGLEFVDFPAGVTNFLNLTDTPSSFSGQGGKHLKVNGAANAVEFVDIPVQDNGSNIVTQPTAIDFTGVGVTVTNDGGKASINIPGVASGLVDWKESVLDKDLTTSPVGVEGARYIIAGTGGDWSTFTIDDMVTYTSGNWEKETPEEGTAAWVEDEDTLYVHNGTGWVKFGTTVTHNNLLGLTDGDPHTQYLPLTGTRSMTGGLNMGGNAITNVGNVDGRDVSADGAALDSHLDGGANKHDASEIDVEGGYTYIAGTPTDLESTISAINDQLGIGGGGGGAGGIEGLRVTEDTLASAWTQVNTSVWEDTGLQVTITTIEDERVHLHVDGTIVATTAGSLGFQLRFVIDGTPYGPQHYNYMHGTAGNQRMAMEATFTSPELTAGPHTIKVQGYRNGVAHDWGIGATLQVTQYLTNSLLPVQVTSFTQLEYNDSESIDIKANTGDDMTLVMNNGDLKTHTGTMTWSFNAGKRVGNTSGLGLDTGSEASSTWYYLYAVPDATNGGFTVVASDNPPPSINVGPTGYTVYKYLGAFYNKSDSNIRQFIQSGKEFRYTGEMRIYANNFTFPEAALKLIDRPVAGGGSISTTFTTNGPVSVDSAIPQTSKRFPAWMHADFDSADTWSLRISIDNAASTWRVVLDNEGGSKRIQREIMMEIDSTNRRFHYASLEAHNQTIDLCMLCLGYIDEYIDQSNTPSYVSGGLNGLVVTEDTLTSVWLQTTENTWQDTGLQVTIDTLENERVQLVAKGSVWATETLDLGFQSRFDIDGTTQSPLQYHYLDRNNNNGRGPLTMAWVTPALSAGSHTIKIQSLKSIGASDAQWRSGNILQAVQYRGGFAVPIQDEGTTVLSGAAAMNFVGSGVTLSDVSGVATVTIPGGGAADFTDLNDTPANYTSQANKVVAVNAGETALEFIDAPTGSKTRYATATNYTTSGEDIIGVTDTTADRTITLASTDASNGKEIIVKDESGAVYTNGTTITVDTEGSETIDGVSSVPITMDHGVLRLYSDGTNWFTV